MIKVLKLVFLFQIYINANENSSMNEVMFHEDLLLKIIDNLNSPNVENLMMINKT